MDMSAPAHVLVFRPLIERLRRRGHVVEVTARDYTQTLDLLELHRIPHVRIGRHGGAARGAKLVALAARARAMVAFGRRRRFDLAVAHGSNELALAAAALGIPAVNMLDYEFAAQQLHVGCRPARRVIAADAIPPERLERFGVDRAKLVRFPGLKEEYYLAGHRADPDVLERHGVDRRRVVATVRPPAEISLYHRKSNPLFQQVLRHLGRREDVHAVVLPRTEAQRHAVDSLRLPSVLMPDRAVDAQSLIAASDVVISAIGTIPREAAALGVPAYTTFGGRLGGVDEMLIRDGRLRPLTAPRGLEVAKRAAAPRPALRDPEALVEPLLGAVEAAPEA